MNAQEKKTVEIMIGIYCRHKHGTPNGLCDDCEALRDYAFRRLEHCRYGEDKPTCQRCSIHCYRLEEKNRIREVMRYAGPRMIWHSPWSALVHIYKLWIGRRRHGDSILSTKQ